MVDLEKIKSWQYPTREEMRQAIYTLIEEVERLRNMSGFENFGRKVIVYKDQKQTEEDFQGKFHIWGSVDVGDGDGNTVGCSTVAVIEEQDGRTRCVYPELVRFV